MSVRNQAIEALTRRWWTDWSVVRVHSCLRCPNCTLRSNWEWSIEISCAPCTSCWSPEEDERVQFTRATNARSTHSNLSHTRQTENLVLEENVAVLVLGQSRAVVPGLVEQGVEHGTLHRLKCIYMQRRVPQAVAAYGPEIVDGGDVVECWLIANAARRLLLREHRAQDRGEVVGLRGRHAEGD